MPTYVVLGKYTDQGIRTIKDSPARAAAIQSAIEAAGGKLKDLYYVIGQYDFVAIAETPSDEVAMGLLLAMGAQGSLRSETLKAFSREAMAAIISRLP